MNSFGLEPFREISPGFYHFMYFLGIREFEINNDLRFYL